MNLHYSPIRPILSPPLVSAWFPSGKGCYIVHWTAKNLVLRWYDQKLLVLYLCSNWNGSLRLGDFCFLVFTPKTWEDVLILTHIFRTGWLNHLEQLHWNNPKTSNKIKIISSRNLPPKKKLTGADLKIDGCCRFEISCWGQFWPIFRRANSLFVFFCGGGNNRSLIGIVHIYFYFHPHPDPSRNDPIWLLAVILFRWFVSTTQL